MAIPAVPAAHASNIEARLLRQGETLHVPYIFDVEVLQAFRRALRRELTGRRAGEALEECATCQGRRTGK
jgi:predicted nucleic acid-binding protein